MVRAGFARRFAAVFVILALVSACSSSTVIRSNVRGAKVFVDGAYVGKTPYVMSDTKIVGSTTVIQLEAHGYEPIRRTIKRNEEFSIGACIGGVFLLVPFLWIMGYRSEHTYQLKPAPGAAPPGMHRNAPPPPPPPPGA